MSLIVENKKFAFESFDEILHSFDTNTEQYAWLLPVVEFLRLWYTQDQIELKTSGSTGIPKTIYLSKQTMLHSAQMTNQFFALQSDTKALLCLPANYIAGKMMLVRAIAGEYDIIAVKPQANPFQEGSQHIIDFTAITPYQLFNSIQSLKNFPLRKAIVGGGQVSMELEKKVSSLPVEFYETFGMTETASHIALRKFNQMPDSLSDEETNQVFPEGLNNASVEVPNFNSHQGLDHTSLFEKTQNKKSNSFVALSGVKLSVDERSCLVIYAPHLHSKALTTNDVVELSQDQNSFVWQGRFDRVVNSGGVKLFPEQIERKIQAFLSSDFFVDAVPDKALGQKLVLYVESEAYSADNLLKLKGQFSEHLTKYEVPTKIYFLPSFVRSESNKILREQSKKL